MVDSRQKGARGEYLVRDKLREASDLQWERIPASGALEWLKGDLHVPHADNRFCVEVKNYKDSAFNDRMFTSKTNHVVNWWAKVVEQAALRDQRPLLVFKYDRSKLFVMTDIIPLRTDKFMYINWLSAYALLLDEWLLNEEIQWLNNS